MAASGIQIGDFDRYLYHLHCFFINGPLGKSVIEHIMLACLTITDRNQYILKLIIFL